MLRGLLRPTNRPGWQFPKFKFSCNGFVRRLWFSGNYSETPTCCLIRELQQLRNQKRFLVYIES